MSDTTSSEIDQAPPAPATGNAPTSTPAASAITLTDDLLAILVCPLTRSKLQQDGDWLVATSPVGAGLRYPIRGGIPVLLIDEATLPDGIASLDEFKNQYADAIPG